jgi:hypothetical protein
MKQNVSVVVNASHKWNCYKQKILMNRNKKLYKSLVTKTEVKILLVSQFTCSHSFILILIPTKERLPVTVVVPRLVKKLTAFYGTQSLITMFIRSRHWTPFRARLIQSRTLLYVFCHPCDWTYVRCLLASAFSFSNIFVSDACGCNKRSVLSF